MTARWRPPPGSTLMTTWTDHWKDGPVEADRGWRFVSIGYEGQQADVAGVNPWEVE